MTLSKRSFFSFLAGLPFVGVAGLVGHAAAEPSKWHRAMGMRPGDMLVETAREVDGMLIVTGWRIERNGAVVKRTEVVPSRSPPDAA